MVITAVPQTESLGWDGLLEIESVNSYPDGTPHVREIVPKLEYKMNSSTRLIVVNTLKNRDDMLSEWESSGRNKSPIYRPHPLEIKKEEELISNLSVVNSNISFLTFKR